MSKRPESTETVQLAIELIRRIPRRPSKVTAQQLHQQLSEAGIARDVRTIQRQLKVLTEHFDIECHSDSKPYGYSWKAGTRGLSLIGLNAQESLLLTLAEQHLRNLLPAKVIGSMESFFLQARTNLTQGGNSGREREWLEKVRVVSTTQPLLPPTIDDEVFSAVSDALYSNHWLEIAYINRGGKEVEAQVMPLGLAQQGVQLYLVCRFKGYDNERSLALHRFRKARMMSLGFMRPQEFSLREYDNDGRFGYGDGKRIQLSFTITREAGLHLLEARLSSDQEVEHLDADHLRISATVVDSAQLTWWLNSFGGNVRDVVRTPLPAA